MNLIKLLIDISKQKNKHFISIPFELWIKWRLLFKIAIAINKNYVATSIFRKEYKNLKNIVVIGLKWNGKNVKRRTTGFAKEQLKINKDIKCVYCSCELNEKNATADHIVPISEGGNNCQVNLIATCFDCNNERGNTPFKEYYITKQEKYEKYIFV